MFQGNILFASLNQMEFRQTSRRDDLISLFFLLVYLLNRGDIRGIDFSLNKLSLEA